MNKPAKDRKYAVGDRVLILSVFEEELAQPREFLLKYGKVTQATDVDGYTRVLAGKAKNQGYFYKGHQICPINDGVVFVAFNQVIQDYQNGVELDVAMARNGFKLIL